MTAQATTTSKNTVVIPVEIQLFLENLIKEANIPTYDDESKQQMVRELFERLDKYIALKIAEYLTDEEAEQFIKMNEEKKSQKELDAFIAEHIPDAQVVFTQAFADFRDFYLTAQNNFQAMIQQGNPQ